MEEPLDCGHYEGTCTQAKHTSLQGICDAMLAGVIATAVATAQDALHILRRTCSLLGAGYVRVPQRVDRTDPESHLLQQP